MKQDDAYKRAIKKKLYERYFTNLHSSEKGMQYTSTKIMNARILEIYKGHHAKKILDAGCGDGLFIDAAKKHGMKCEGFDTNEDLLNVCRKKGHTVKYGDLSQKLPYKDNTFDGIFCSNVFEHLAEPEFALYELVRILKRGGLLILTVPEADTKIFFNDWTHITFFTKQTFNNLMKCVDIKDYWIYRRHFPILIRLWGNPIIRFANWLIERGPIASVFTYIFEKLTFVRRHDFVVEVIK